MIGALGVLLLGAAPLQFTTWLTPAVSVVTSVLGEMRNIAQVTIVYGTAPVWSGTMTQAAPTLVIDTEMIYGSLEIASGATFTLTIPTPIQLGGVFLHVEVLQPSPPQKYYALVATWPLSSMAAPAVYAFPRF